MARHHDKLISRSSEAVAAAGQPPPRTQPRTRAEVEAFVRGFGLSARATRRLVDEWTADVARAHSAGYDAAAEDYY